MTHLIEAHADAPEGLREALLEFKYRLPAPRPRDRDDPNWWNDVLDYDAGTDTIDELETHTNFGRVPRDVFDEVYARYLQNAATMTRRDEL